MAKATVWERKPWTMRLVATLALPSMEVGALGFASVGAGGGGLGRGVLTFFEAGHMVERARGSPFDFDCPG